MVCWNRSDLSHATDHCQVHCLCLPHLPGARIWDLADPRIPGDDHSPPVYILEDAADCMEGLMPTRGTRCPEQNVGQEGAPTLET